MDHSGDLIEAVAGSLRTSGVHLLSAAELTRAIGVTGGSWAAFGAHWDELRPDRYAAELGTRRLRRYGHFAFRAADGTLERLPHESFVQPQGSNRLYLDRDRRFEPLTERFACDPVLRAVIRLLGRLAQSLDDVSTWHVKVTPFRVVATTDSHGDPTPEGVHRDGVTLVSALLIGRRNADGGESSVYDTGGHLLLATTLTEPGTLLVGDDRRTLHGVTAIRPVDPMRPAHRDVLVVTFAHDRSCPDPGGAGAVGSSGRTRTSTRRRRSEP
ncbi:2OG-Fe dioxygenase family protein [Mycolicibacterium litorale]|uniref:2OG-Fe dioxygenase family protein n=1 Tax=Mycolicibacterium litorale TaxID=758802 RepID=UPI003CF93BAF